MTRTFAAMTHLDEAVTGAGGVALRYSGLYGPHEDTQTKAVRKRRYPVIGDGGGITSFIDLHDATAATLLALEHDGPAIYNVTDDEPTAMREWLPALAAALGAKPTRHYPLWAGRLFMGDALAVMTQAPRRRQRQGKTELGWTLRYPSWRQGLPPPTAVPSHLRQRPDQPAAHQPPPVRLVGGRSLTNSHNTEMVCCARLTPRRTWACCRRQGGDVIGAGVAPSGCIVRVPHPVVYGLRGNQTSKLGSAFP